MNELTPDEIETMRQARRAVAHPLGAAAGSELVLRQGQYWENCPNCKQPVWLSRLPHPPEIEPLQRNDPPERVTLRPEYDIVMRDYRPNCPHCKIRLNISVVVDAPNNSSTTPVR